MAHLRDWENMSGGGILNWYTGLTHSSVERHDHDWMFGVIPITEDLELPMESWKTGKRFTITIGQMRQYLIDNH